MSQNRQDPRAAGTVAKLRAGMLLVDGQHARAKGCAVYDSG